MRFARVRTVIGGLALVLTLFGVVAVWAQPSTSPPQPAPGTMGPGMMGQMPMMPMAGDMNQMMQACVQMMNQMMGGATSTLPAQPGQGNR